MTLEGAITNDQAEELRSRIGTAWRELRRGASAVRIKDLFYGAGPDGLDLALADALSVLCQRGPMRMGELADALHITPASTTRAVSCLAEKGYAERVRDEADQRSIQVMATPAGFERYAVIADRIQSGMRQILDEFDEGEKAVFADLLERYVRSVESYVAHEDARANDG